MEWIGDWDIVVFGCLGQDAGSIQCFFTLAQFKIWHRFIEKCVIILFIRVQLLDQTVMFRFHVCIVHALE